MVLAQFMAEGYFLHHIRRMRTLHAARQSVLIQSLNTLIPMIQVSQADAGMQLIGWLPAGVDDQTAALAAAEHGVEIVPLSAYRMTMPGRGGLLFGYAALEDAAIREGIKHLSIALRPLLG